MDGKPLRDHLLAVERVSKKRPPELDGPQMPEGAVHVWRWFNELNEGRRLTGFGVSPLIWADIESWARVTGRLPLEFWEAGALRLLDKAYMKVMVPKKEGSSK